MPVFHEAGPEARERLVQTSKGYQLRQVFRDQLGKLSDDGTLELQPENGETLRRLKVNVRRAANELNMSDVRYGETTDGMLLVWRQDRPRTGRRGRARRAETAS